MKTTFIFVRHGETIWNKEKRFQGMSDMPLTELGLTQAGYVRDALKNRHIDACYTSPLQRAFRTGELIMEAHGGSPTAVYDLHEQALGVWEGMLITDIQAQYPEEFYNWWFIPSKCRIPEGETFQEVQARMVEAFRKIEEAERGHTVLIVAHMGCLSSLLLHIADRPLDEIWEHPLNNCSISEVEVEDGVSRITVWNESSHLPVETQWKRPAGMEKLKDPNKEEKS